MDEDADVSTGLIMYLVGLGLAVILTAASFWAVSTHLIYGPGIAVALVALAIAQMGVHLVFFLHISTAPDNTNNVIALVFGALAAGVLIQTFSWCWDRSGSWIISITT